MPRRTTLTLTAALVASTLAASPALAEPTHLPFPAYPTPEPSKAYTIDDGRSADTRDAAKDAAVQPGQPTWPLHPKVLTPPKAHAEQSATSDDDGIWLVVGLGLSAAALAGGAGAARYARVRARRVAV